MPNEKGLLFLAKHIVKSCLIGRDQHYSWSDILNSALGRLSRVERNEHKGFDWELITKEIEKYFVLVEVDGVQFSWLPPWANAQIGVVARIRK